MLVNDIYKHTGHSSTVTTSMIYSHAIQSADEAASDVLGDLLLGKRLVRSLRGEK